VNEPSEAYARLLTTPAIDAPTAVLDFETTGLSVASGDRVCEVAVVRGRPGGGRRKKFTQLLDPQREMPALAQQIHGLSDADLAGKPRFVDILPKLARVLEGAVIVAHNAPFDIGFLRAECHMADAPIPSHGPVVCTLDLARHVYGFSKCSLEALARRTETHQATAHRALADTVTTMRVYRRMLEGLGGATQAPPTVGDLLHRIEHLSKGAAGREAIGLRIRAAAGQTEKLHFDYTDRYGPGPLTRRRTVTIDEFKSPYFEGMCHTTGERSTFNVRRVQRILE
jgi:DNA polymerase III epsilon subunit family exonuclease